MTEALVILNEVKDLSLIFLLPRLTLSPQLYNSGRRIFIIERQDEHG
jgi:hypothetical protein